VKLQNDMGRQDGTTVARIITNWCVRRRPPA